ncbi:efflux RND transporter periplasmic adaptor subunit [Acidisoma sp. C75]
MRVRLFPIVLASLALGTAGEARAQMGPGGPPPVGVTKASVTPIYPTSQYIGRVQAMKKVTIRARVTGTLEERDFKEGDEVKKGQQLFVIEQAPYQAAVLQAQGQLLQAEAALKNAKQNLTRSQTLLNTPAGQRSTFDTDVATAGQSQGQLLVAEAALKTAQINLGYTTVTAPIDGRIGIATDPGNTVSFADAALATIVSQDPEYVTFPVSEVEVMKLEQQYAGKGGLGALNVRIKLPNGQMYDQTGHINFSDISVNASTDTIALRATIPNPLHGAPNDAGGSRTLVDGSFVTVLLEAAQPDQAITVPRSAVLADQQGYYVFVIGPKDVAERRNVTLGSSPDPTLAVIASGLKAGDEVVADGVQRVHPGAAVKPVPYTPPKPPSFAEPNGSSG